MSNEIIYDVVNADGNVINKIVLDVNSDWQPPEGCTIHEHQPEIIIPVSILVISKLQFLRRFTAEERIVIRASADPVIVDFLHLLDLAQEVRLDDADTQAGVRYLESAGLLAAGRAEAILAS